MREYAEKTELRNPLLLVGIFLISRVIVWWSGVSVDMTILGNHWQYLDPSLLEKDLLTSILYQHSQPPLMNFIVGVGLKVSNYLPFSDVSFFNIILSTTGVLNSLLMYYTLNFYVKEKLSLAFSVLYLLSPGFIFYENYIFYPIVVCLFLSIYAYFTTRLIFSNGASGMDYLASLLGLLFASLTWSAVHPLFVVLFSGANLYIYQQNQGSRKQIAVGLLIAVALLSLLPSAKNYVYYDTFSRSSWAGLNLSTVAPGKNQECRFKAIDSYEIELGFHPVEHASLTDKYKSYKGKKYSNFNHYIIPKVSDKCLRMSAMSIAKKPVTYLTGVIKQLIISHSLPSSDYGFTPKNWDNIDKYIKVYRSAYINSITYEYSDYWSLHVVNLLSYFVIYSLGFILVLKYWFRNEEISPLGTSFILFYSFCFTFTMFIHMLNGGEQHRMRFSMSLLHAVLAIVITYNLYSYSTGLSEME